MTINYLKKGVEPTAGTLCAENVFQTMDNALHNRVAII
jgi:hypothetical protein